MVKPVDWLPVLPQGKTFKWINIELYVILLLNIVSFMIFVRVNYGLPYKLQWKTIKA